MIKKVFFRILFIPFHVFFKLIFFLNDLGFIKLKKIQKLKEKKNSYKGKKAIILGNGPSVDLKFCEKISKGDFIIFAANRIHLVYPETKFRPHYVVSSDPQVISDFGNEIKEQNSKEGIATFFAGRNYFNAINDLYLLFLNPFKFKSSPYYGLAGGGGSLFIAIQLAYYFGITEMYLYGVDHNFKFDLNNGLATGDNNHFIKDYRSGKKWIPPRTKLIEQSFRECDQFLLKKNGFLVNGTNGGKLNTLKRKNLNEIL
jgi:hypothetical protein